jgi:prephenate dehydrogenase
MALPSAGNGGRLLLEVGHAKFSFCEVMSRMHGQVPGHCMHGDDIVLLLAMAGECCSRWATS